MKPYLYYPGCSQAGTSVEYDMSARALMKALGSELVEMEDWTCCGSSPAHNIDRSLSAALSARNLVLAKKMSANALVTGCPSCLANLKTAETAASRPVTRVDMNLLLEEPYEGGVEPKGLLQVILEEVGPALIAKKTKSSLSGLKIACYYGCLTTRPAGLMDFGSEENPSFMERVLEAAGAKCVDFPMKTECCGASMAVPVRDSVPRLAGRILSSARDLGADAIAVACPLCHMNLDLRRSQINSANLTDIQTPVFYFTQLLGLALGLGKKELGLNKLSVDPGPVLKKLAAREGEQCA